MSDSKVKVIIADTQFLIVESLKALLQADEKYMVHAVVPAKSELYKSLREVGEGLLITDLILIDYTGISDLKEIRREYPDVSVLILTNSISKPELTELTKSGIKSVIYKTANKDEIFAAIEATLAGKKFYCDEVLDLLLDQTESKIENEKGRMLTNSEIEIVKLIATGQTAKEIANTKYISIHTVNTHRKNIFRKLGVSNTSELIMVAIKAGWINNIEYYI